jgi:1-acyl-sn-glycerol-3-phosphate acyltransferase
MLPAKPNRIVQKWFDGWCRRSLRAHFNRVHLYLEPDSHWTDFDPSVPRIYVANHSSFWDGIVLNFLLGQFRRQQPRYCMIDEVQVHEHPFFLRINGFSIRRDDARDSIDSIRYSVDLLQRTDRPACLVLFPQGKIESNDTRPIRVEAAAPRIIQACPEARVVPVGLRYEFWSEQRAEAMVQVGPELRLGGLGRARIAQTIQTKLMQALEVLRQAGLAQRRGDVIALHGRRSISRWKSVFCRGST